MAVSEPSPGLFVCGLEPALKLSLLTRRNIKLIVNVSGIQGLQYPRVQVPDLEVVEVPVQDRPHAPLDQYFDSVSEKIHQVLQQNQSVLVHCTAGRSRSPALILAYLLRFSSLSLADAHLLVLKSRPFIRINAGFWRQLMDYEVRVQNRSTIRMVKTEAGVLPHALNQDQDGDQNQDLGLGYCING